MKGSECVSVEGLVQTALQSCVGCVLKTGEATKVVGAQGGTHIAMGTFTDPGFNCAFCPSSKLLRSYNARIYALVR